MKKYTLLWLVLVSIWPTSMFSLTSLEGEGTKTNPYLIKNLTDLKCISDNDNYWEEGQYFRQTKDINASDTNNWNEGKGFIPIGNSLNNCFKGVYDGQGNKIINLFINKDNNGCGLFGYTQNAVIKNIVIDNIDLTGKEYVGAFIGIANASQIINCSSSGKIAGNHNESCVGGIIGASKNATQVLYSSSSATIQGKTGIGGIMGLSYRNITIKNCYFTGSLSGDNYIGGILGKSNHDYHMKLPTIENCYIVSNITYQDSSFCGMIVGENLTNNIKRCKYQSGNNLNGVGSNSDITNFTTEAFEELSQNEMQDPTNYINSSWDFDTTWLLDDDMLNIGYPYLYWQQTSPHTLLIYDDDTLNSNSFVSPDVGIDLEILSGLSGNTQILINKYESTDLSTNGIDTSHYLLSEYYWEINTTPTEAITYNITLDISDMPDILGSLKTDKVKIMKRENQNTEWVDVTSLNAEVSWNNNKVTVSGLNSFSDFIPIFDISETLPVELSNFSMNVVDNNTININWEVESESNLSGYYLLYNNCNDIDSADLIPSLIPATNTSQHYSYSFTHHPKISQGTIYYWLKCLELNNQVEYYGPIMTSLEDENDNNPAILIGNHLYPSYPNPFNPSTTISFSVEKPQFVNIKIYNIKGQVVKSLLSEYIDQPNHKHSIIWHGRDDDNKVVSSGIYLIKMKLGNKMFEKKAILQK